MSAPAFNAAEVGLSLARTLEDRGLPYALGGALAYGVWALPRATRDVDLNLFLEPDRLPPALDVLSGAGVAFDRAEALSFFKMMFFRGKDLVDLERLLGTMGRKLDAPYVRKWLVETMGPDDERVRKWDELCDAFWREAP